jgi:DNA-binding transcriptional LysR family regulator
MSKAGGFDFNLFRAIEVFVAVVETRHVTRAAEMLGMTQSAASQRLKNLELALGAQLIERGQRPVALTRAGIALHRRATMILSEVDALRAEVRRVESAPLPLLRVAMLASIATTLTPMLARLARDTFGIPELSLFAGLTSDHQTLLRNRRIDLAITSDLFFDVEGLTRQLIITERLLLVTPKRYSGPVHNLAELAKKLPFVRFRVRRQLACAPSNICVGSDSSCRVLSKVIVRASSWPPSRRA